MSPENNVASAASHRCAEANRKNAKKSTGPRTAEGKSIARANALKHGLAAQKLVVLGEDAEAFQAMADAHLADFQPRNALELEFCKTFTLAAWRRQRCVTTEAAMTNQYIRDSSRAEEIGERHEVLSLGDRLFFDSQELWLIYPDPSIKYGAMSRRRNSVPGGPDLPSRLLAELESTLEGCRWLLERWSDLERRLKSDGGWHAMDIFKAIRLMGKQPLDVLEDSPGELMDIFLACHKIDGKDKSPFSELRCEVTDDQFPVVLRRLERMNPEKREPADAEHAWSILYDILVRRVRALERLYRIHVARAGPRPPDASAGWRLTPAKRPTRCRRYEDAAIRRMSRACEDLAKLRRSDMFDEDAKARPAAVPEFEETNPKAERSDHKSEEINPKSENSNGDRCTPAVDADGIGVGQPFQADIGRESLAKGSNVRLESRSYDADAGLECPAEGPDLRLDSPSYDERISVAAVAAPAVGEPSNSPSSQARSAIAGNGGLLNVVLLIIGFGWLVAGWQCSGVIERRAETATFQKRAEAFAPGLRRSIPPVGRASVPAVFQPGACALCPWLSKGSAGPANHRPALAPADHARRSRYQSPEQSPPPGESAAPNEPMGIWSDSPDIGEPPGRIRIGPSLALLGLALR